MNPIQAEVHYSGRVQGVGFRYNAERIARGFEVSGFVQNLPDGRVRLVAEGERAEVERFLAAVQESMSANIKGTSYEERSFSGSFPRFEIRH